MGADYTHYSTDTSGCLMLSIIAITRGHDTTDARTSPIRVLLLRQGTKHDGLIYTFIFRQID